MTLASFRRSRWSGVATVATLAVVTSLLGGVAEAASSAGTLGVTMTPCVSPGPTTITATITNKNSSGGQKIGSIFLDATKSNFSNIQPASAFAINNPNWTGHLESFVRSSDSGDLDGLYLTANNSTFSLSGGSSITVTFPVTVGPSTGLKPWTISAWTGTTPKSGSSFTSFSTKVDVENVCLGAPSKLAFSVQPPSSTQSNVAMAGPVSVAIQDANGHTVTTDNTDSVALSFVTDPSGGHAQLSGATATAQSGIATFPNLKVDLQGTGYTLIAKSGSLTDSPSSSPFNITLGASRSISYQVGPSTTTAGATMSAVQVLVTDGINPVSNDIVALSGDASSPTATTDGTGVATFNSITVSQTPKSGASLTATENNGTGQSISQPFDITAPTVAFTNGPQDTQYNKCINSGASSQRRAV